MLLIFFLCSLCLLFCFLCGMGNVFTGTLNLTFCYLLQSRNDIQIRNFFLWFCYIYCLTFEPGLFSIFIALFSALVFSYSPRFSDYFLDLMYFWWISFCFLQHLWSFLALLDKLLSFFSFFFWEYNLIRGSDLMIVDKWVLKSHGADF